MGKGKKTKRNKSNPDYEQLKENLRFIKQEIELAKQFKQRKQVAHLKLKALILKLRYNAVHLHKTAQAAQDLQIDPKDR